MKKFIFYQLKSIQKQCLTFSCNFNADFASLFVTNEFVKKLFFYGTLLLLALSQGSLHAQSTKPSANLDQIRNGSKASPVSPANWVNGNAGASQAHYAEGWSIAYRMLLGNLSTTGSHELVIEWDITHSGKNALDYITSYDNIDNPAGSHLTTFAHPKETIDPTIGITGLGSPATFPILAPGSDNSPVSGMPTDSFNALPPEKRVMTIYNGEITDIQYVSQGNYDSQSQTRMKITFTATDPKVLIAWGGHIAAEYDWGTGNGATSVSGSPYHTRLISIDGTGGNQDRSLAAAAVAPPPPSCAISPLEQSICVGTSAVFSGPAGMSSYAWSISPTGPTLTYSGTNNQTVTVTNAAVANSPYTLTLVTTYFGGITSTDTCTATLTVNETPAPTVTLTQPDCDTATGTIEVTAPKGEGIEYSIDGTNYQLSTTFTGGPTGTYTVTAKANGCVSVSTQAVINNQPSTPDAPTIIINDVSLCGDSLKGSINVCNPIVGYTYRLYLDGVHQSLRDNEAAAGEEITFGDLDAGSNPSVDVITPDGCISGSTGCSGGDKVVTSCPSLNRIAAVTKLATPIEAKTESAGFDAYPVPFKDQLTIKYKFDYVSDTKIEVFNAQGIMVFSKTDNNSYLNKEIALNLKLDKGKEQIYVVKLTTNRGSTSKKVISTK